MRKMIATKDFPYGPNERKVGDQFDVHDHDVDALEITGLAKVVKGKAGGQAYQTKVMTAETEAKRDPQPAAGDAPSTAVAAMTAQASPLVPNR